MRLYTSFPSAFSIGRGYSLNASDFGGMLSECYIGEGGSAQGRAYWVNGGAGELAASGEGTPSNPYTTMAQAFAKITSGDTVVAWGNIKEQLSSPAGVFDVTITGPSPVTRHPDAHTGNNGYSSCRWSPPASPTATTPLLIVRQQGWRLKNILFTGLTASAIDCVELLRDNGAGDAERDASHAQIIGCRFQGGRYGIKDHNTCARVKIYGNEFLLFSTSGNRAITSVAGTGPGSCFGWEIKGNSFTGNLTDISLALQGAEITDNHFHFNGLGVTNVVAIDMTNGSENLIAQNYMYCASNESGVNARFVASATDIYGPNYYSDQAEYGEPAE